jgi:hypothetical protein
VQSKAVPITIKVMNLQVGKLLCEVTTNLSLASKIFPILLEPNTLNISE